MPRESELRLHRCCFLGHRPEKLDQSPEEVRAWLEEQIDHNDYLAGIVFGICLFAIPYILGVIDIVTKK